MRVGLATAIAAMMVGCAGKAPDVEMSVDDHRRAADALYESGEFAACGDAYAASVAAGGTHEALYYNAACCYSLAGDADAAFDQLDGALAAGYRDPDYLEQDSDLAALRDDPRWEGIMAAARAAEAEFLAGLNEELYRMKQADQADRGRFRTGEVDASDLINRDTARRERVYEMLDAGLVTAAEDYFNAALILQHGTESHHYRLARDLARQAAELDPDNRTARWLSAAAHDRYLLSIDKPQEYGTQQRLIDGVWTLEPLDADAVTDAERQAVGVPPIAVSLERAAARNAAPAE